MTAHTIVHTEEGALALDFDPAAHKTAEAAAKALHGALIKAMKAYDPEQDPEIELMLQTPEQAEVRAWRVCWEAGPYQWGIKASMQFHTPDWWSEPYYSFDLLFHENGGAT